MPALPAPPYYAVIFTPVRQPEAGDGYDDTAARMIELATQQPGFLGIESAHEYGRITICYWRDEADIAAWKANAEHQLAQQQGRDRWYSRYSIRIARVERAYGFDDGAS
ncbi:MAG: antibiotic biosynthesis monooxygenase family protein [Actinomycetota bacterium]